VRQDDDWSDCRPAGRDVGLREESPQLRLNTERLQDLMRHEQCSRLLRLADPGDGASAVAVQADLLKDPTLIAIREARLQHTLQKII
jgi:hypothetical protein